MKAAAINWCLWQRLAARRWADGITMWPNAMLTFNHHLGVQIVCLGYLWIHRNVDKKLLFLIRKFWEKIES